MGLIVQKFGGSSVADADRVRNVARIITETYRRGHSVVVVLSAQGDTTDDLIAKAEEINPKASKLEMDMLLSTGEQISCSLCAMAIEAMGYPVVSLSGWQAGVQTNSTYGNARIKRVMAERIQNELDRRSIVIVTGFQGINKYGDVTTLGRGGSDTSAVALAAKNCSFKFLPSALPPRAITIRCAIKNSTLYEKIWLRTRRCVRSLLGLLYHKYAKMQEKFSLFCGDSTSNS